MPTSTKQKVTRGIPRKTRNPARKAKMNRYLARASCFICSLVFRSPKYQKHHIANGHLPLAGVNRKRCSLESWKLFTNNGSIAVRR